jgi:hypothetical protein
MTTHALQGRASTDDDVVEFELLGFSFRAPRREALAITAKITALQDEARQAASVPELLTRLDEVERQHKRAIAELDTIIIAAARATKALT